VTEERAELSSSTDRWQRADAVLWRRTLVGVVVLPPRASEPLFLSGPAAAVWARLGRPITREELHVEVTRAFRDRDTVTKEVDYTLGQLRDLGGVCRL
jgi:hypothetical protein